MLTGDELLKKFRSIDLSKEPTEQKAFGSFADCMRLALEEQQPYFYENKLRKQRRLGLPIQGPLTLEQSNRNNEYDT